MSHRADRIVFETDSSETPVYERRDGSADNGHFEALC
jgi:hypothetical protein